MALVLSSEALTHMWPLRPTSLAAATLALLASLSADAAAGLMFLRESPLSRFTEKDFEILRNAASVVLNSSDSGAAQDWSNDASGNSGKITALSQFTATDGRLCKRLKLDARSPEFDGSWTYTVCRGVDGDWKIDSAAQPGASGGKTNGNAHEAATNSNAVEGDKQ